MSRSTPLVRIAFVLGVASAIAIACAFPYLLALNPGLLESSPVSPTFLVVAQAAQTGVMCFLFGWAGLKLGDPLGLGAPWLAAWLYGRSGPITSSWLSAALLGALGSIGILGLVAVFGATPDIASTHVAAPWKGLLASPFGAIAEETALRVFLLGSVAWLLARTTGGAPRAWVIATAIAIAALVFGLSHLPLLARIEPLTAAIIARAIIYNSLLGLAFGWLYWKRGLEHAMLAHFCADLVVHVAAPLAMGG
ncbi:MAG: CPBP family glutamic-type intramembrane protease [Dokdonella sp.]